jgi:hypothetical protein
MAFRQGTTVRPELMRSDFTPILQGGIAGGQAYAQGLRGLGAGIGKAVEQRKMMKSEVKATQDFLKNPIVGQALEQMGMGGDQMTEMLETMKDGSLREQFAVSRQLNPLLSGIVGASIQRMGQTPKPDINIGDIIGRATDATGKINLGKAFSILDDIEGANREDYNAIRLAVSDMQPPPEMDDKRLKSPTVFIGPEGDIATFGLDVDGLWTRRYKDADGKMVSETKPKDWIALDAAKGGAMTGEQFTGQAEELRLIESGLQQLDEFRESREGAGTGIDFAKNYLGAQFKALLGGKKMLTEAERDAVVAKGTLRALVGKFRVDTVGPGIMTEEDARRIEDALGGAMLTGNMEKVNEMLDKLVRDATSRSALLRTNLEAAQQINPQLGMYTLPDKYSPGDALSFDTIEAAESANLPVGTEILVGGRKAIVE